MCSSDLADAGFDVTRRTVERDLQKLSMAGFPVTWEVRDGLQQWTLSGTAGHRLPALPTVSDAVLLLLARDHLTPLLPPPMRRVLAPTFRQAEGVLASARRTQHLARWRDKVRATLPAQTLLAPTIRPAVQEVCTDALLTERQLRVVYESRSRGARQSLVLHPLALVQRGLITYLVATAPPHTDPRLYALHRVRRAQQLDAPAKPAPQFDVDAFLSQGFADFGQGRQVQLRLRVSATVATHLAECRLSEDQRITRLNTPPGWCRISATVNDTPQLRWWIRGFGAEVVAESPILA